MLCSNLNQTIMKINEASVIDNKVIDDMIAECKQILMRDNITFNEDVTITVKLSVLKHIKSQLKPLEPIVSDAYTDGMSTDGDWEYCSNKYVEETEI